MKSARGSPKSWLGDGWKRVKPSAGGDRAGLQALDRQARSRPPSAVATGTKPRKKRKEKNRVLRSSNPEKMQHRANAGLSSVRSALTFPISLKTHSSVNSPKTLGRSQACEGRSSEKRHGSGVMAGFVGTTGREGAKGGRSGDGERRREEPKGHYVAIFEGGRLLA